MAPPEQLDDDPLAALRERIRSTAEAADRLADQASRAQGANGVPPRTDEATQEAQALVNLVALLRDLIPDELRQQILDLVRQVLKLLRAVIDWYLERLDSGPRNGGRAGAASREPVVEDIPLD